MNAHRLKQRVKFGKLYLSRMFNVPLARPSLIAVFVTPRCNLKCIMCGFPDKPEEPEMTTGEIKSLLDRIKAFGVHRIDIAGGEPFLRDDIFDILEHAQSLELQTNITTNAYLLNEECVDRIFAAGVFALQFSLDGADAATHDMIRGVAGSFNRVLEATELVNKRRKPDHFGPLLNATTVIMRHNVGQLMDIVRLTRDRGFVSITFQPVADDNMRIMVKNPDNPLRPRPEQLPVLDGELDELVAYRDKHGYVCNSDQHVRLMRQYFHNQKLDTFACYSGFFTGTISNDGKFRSICMGEFGDVRTQSLEEIWRSDKARRIRTRVKRCKSPCLYPCWVDPDSV